MAYEISEIKKVALPLWEATWQFFATSNRGGYMTRRKRECTDCKSLMILPVFFSSTNFGIFLTLNLLRTLNQTEMPYTFFKTTQEKQITYINDTEFILLSTCALLISSCLTEIGIGLVGFGILFSFLGVILFFDRGLLALGNIFFFKGVGLLLGWQSLLQLFTKKANIKGSVPFFLGLFLLFVRWPIAGMIMELYGTFVLFSGYAAPIQAFLYQIPIIGWILQYPFQLFGLRRKRA